MSEAASNLERLTSKLLINILEQIPFFCKFTSEEQQVLLEDTDTFFVTIEKGEAIIREGDEDGTLFVMLEGSAAITKNKCPGKIIAQLQQGSIFGEISFLTGRMRTTNVIALSRCMLFRIDGATFNNLGPSIQLKLQHQLILTLVERLDKMNDSIIRWIR
jgi:CRP-like cAMP-binding protein